jgi:hypothetical protein
VTNGAAAVDRRAASFYASKIIDNNAAARDALRLSPGCSAASLPASMGQAGITTYD